MMKIVIVLLVALFSISTYAAVEVGPTSCPSSIPTIETDAFNPRESWVSGGRNWTIWEHRFNFFTSEAPYKVYDILVQGQVYDPSATLSTLWELEAVAGYPGYYRFPSWRRDVYVGISGSQAHSFGYITSSEDYAFMMSFSVVKYTCTPNYPLSP